MVDTLSCEDRMRQPHSNKFIKVLQSNNPNKGTVG